MQGERTVSLGRLPHHDLMHRLKAHEQLMVPHLHLMEIEDVRVRLADLNSALRLVHLVDRMVHDLFEGRNRAQDFRHFFYTR